jgi:P27 family predicted phage terminase small subunit
MGERGPKPLPANVHALHGNPGKRNLAAMLDETVRPPVEIPAMPRHLAEEARREWRRITKHLEALGLISQIDRAALAAYCSAWGDYVWAENRIAQLNGPRKAGDQELAADETGDRGRIWDTPSGYKQISVPMQIRNRALEMMGKFLAEFGMSPAARSRVTASDPQGALPGFEKPKDGGWGDFPKAAQ